MTLDYSGSSQNNPAGKASVCRVKFGGSIYGVDATLILKGESEEDIYSALPIADLREIDLKIVDPNQKIEAFVREEEKLMDELLFGLPVDKPVLPGKCSDCALEIWVYPEEVEPLCPKCEKERKIEAFRKGQKADLKEKRLKDSEIKAEDEFILRLEGESAAEYDARKKRIETQRYTEERKKRASTPGATA